MAKKILSTRIDEDVLQEVDDLAAEESRLIGVEIDRTAYVQRALREDVKRRRSALAQQQKKGGKQ